VTWAQRQLLVAWTAAWAQRYRRVHLFYYTSLWN